MAPSWIITLHAGATPALIPEPPAPLARYAFFTSRTLEDGRERFRLHMGFFDDLAGAKNALRLVRESYPAAWLVPADQYQAWRRTPPTLPTRAIPPQQEESAPLEAAEVLALLGGAAELLAGVLPEVNPDEPAIALAGGGGSAVSGTTPGSAVPAAAAAGPSARSPGPQLAEALVRDVSRFIVEEWQPEARRPSVPKDRHAWYARLRFRRGKRPPRAQTGS